jgi:hypothetical protein
MAILKRKIFFETKTFLLEMKMKSFPWVHMDDTKYTCPMSKCKLKKTLKITIFPVLCKYKVYTKNSHFQEVISNFHLDVGCTVGIFWRYLGTFFIFYA